jgi:Trk-type K+ transport system membrane component
MNLFLTIANIYVYGVVSTYSFCRLLRIVRNNNTKTDKEVTLILSCLSWIGTFILLKVAYLLLKTKIKEKIIKSKINNHGT